jgi:hypothetical protein
MTVPWSIKGLDDLMVVPIIHINAVSVYKMAGHFGGFPRSFYPIEKNFD